MFYQPGRKLIYANIEMSIRATIEIQDLFYLAGGISESIVKGVYVPYGAANLAAGLVNRAAPGTDDLVSLSADPSHAALTGFTFNAASEQYLQIGSNIYLDGDYSVLMRVANLASGDGYLMGCNDGVGVYAIQEASGAFTLTNGTDISGVTFASTTGLAIAGTKAYRNGAAVAGTFTPLSAPLLNPAYVGGLNDGTPDFYDSFDLLWMIVYSGTLTEAQVAAVYAAAPV